MDEIIEELKKYKHVYTNTVKFSDVDSFNVVHNIQYLYWVGWAREEYMRDLFQANDKQFSFSDFTVMIVHTDIDYFEPLHHGETYKILTRISQVKDSSLTFKNIIISGTKLISSVSSVLVNLDLKSKQKERIPDYIRKLISDYEIDADKIYV